MRIAINGYGRIGKCILRSFYEGNYSKYLELVCVNASMDLNTFAHITKYDSVHGRFPLQVLTDTATNSLIIGSSKVKLTNERDPALIPLKEMQVDCVIDCTGVFTSKEKTLAYLNNDAKVVLISAPATGDVDATVVYGVNHELLDNLNFPKVISASSCTTNCLAPLITPLLNTIGIETGFFTTIHSYTNDQSLVDARHKDYCRGRSAVRSMIPTKTGAMTAIGLIYPELSGKLDGIAVRVPTDNVSMLDFSFVSSKNTTKQEVNLIYKEFIESQNLKNFIDYNAESLVSVDFNHSFFSCIFDANYTKVIGSKNIKVIAWYDNEWGFSNRMLDIAVYCSKQIKKIN